MNRIPSHRVGYAGIRVGEADHPGMEEPSDQDLPRWESTAATSGDERTACSDDPYTQQDHADAHASGTHGRAVTNQDNPFAGIFGPLPNDPPSTAQPPPRYVAEGPGSSSDDAAVGPTAHSGPTHPEPVDEDAGEVMCTMCLGDLEADQELIRWPSCGHTSHAVCAAHFLRVHCCADDVGAPFPPLNSGPGRFRVCRVRCPVRGEVRREAGGIEACTERFGTDIEAQRTYNVLIQADRRVVIARGNTERQHDPIPPEEPTHISVLCHHQIGPPPDFHHMPDRRADWAPVAQHSAGSDGNRRVQRWIPRWLCHACNSMIHPSDVHPPSPHERCGSCGRLETWVHDVQTHAAAWRCRFCDPQDADVRPVLPHAAASTQRQMAGQLLGVGMARPDNERRVFDPVEYARHRAAQLRATMARRARRAHSMGRDIPMDVAWSDFLNPWLWLAAERSDRNAFTDALAELFEAVPAGITDLMVDGSRAIRGLWHETTQAFNDMGIASAAQLLQALQAQRAPLQEWVRRDPRYNHISAIDLPAEVGDYMDNYVQEFLVTRLAAQGARFHYLAPLLQAAVRAHALQLHDDAGVGGALPHAGQPPTTHSAEVALPPFAPINGMNAPQAANAEARNDERMAADTAGSDGGDSAEEVHPRPAVARGANPPPDPNCPYPQTRARLPHASRSPLSDEVWNSLLGVDLQLELQTLVPTLDECPFFLRGALRTAHTTALQRLRQGYQQHSDALVQQGWVLFLLTSRMLLARPENQEDAGREELLARAQLFNQGGWVELLETARRRAAAMRPRAPRSVEREEDDRLQRACSEVRRGAPSRARQTLTAAEIAPGNEETWAELTDPARRPPQPGRPIPQAAMEFAPREAVRLDLNRFFNALRGAKKGTAGGPSGTKAQHLKPLLEDETSMALLGFAASCLATAHVPQNVARAIALCRLTALRKENGRVIGIATGDVFLPPRHQDSGAAVC